MFNNIALSILFTTNIMHNVTADEHGDLCEHFCIYAPWNDRIFCHTLSWNGRYRRDQEGNLVGQKRCVFERKSDESKDKPCISDHECDYEHRHENKDVMYNPALVCDIDVRTAKSNPNIINRGKCVKPPPPPKKKPAREEDQNRGNHGMACKGNPAEQCNSGLECMHPHKVTLDGCYHPASTVREGMYCFDHVECMEDLECYKFIIPKTIAPQGYGRNAKTFEKQTKLCAPRDSDTVMTTDEEGSPTEVHRVYETTGNAPYG